MATLYITELSHITRDPSNNPILAPLVPGIEQSVSIGAVSTSSAAFNTLTNFILINTDTTCFLAFGDGSATATTSKHRMSANETRFYSVRPGMVVAVIS